MARLIKGTTHLDVYYYELAEAGIVHDHAMDYYDESKSTHSFDEIFPVRRCMLGELEMKCPNDPHKFLETTYGKGAVEKPNKRCVLSTWRKQ